MDKISLDIENFEMLPEEYSDEQLATVEVYVCHDGNNRHNIPITREALIKAKDTLKNKFLVAGFDGNDFEGHEPDEMIVGFFPESSEMKFVKINGKTYLVARAIMSKVYAKWAYDIFVNSKNHRDVSMEITVLKGQVDEYDNLLTIEEFVFNGVTILGLSHVPACEGSSASIIKFDYENALKVYNEHRNETTMVEFSGKEETETMDETKDIVEAVETETTTETPEVEVVEEQTPEATSVEEEVQAESEDNKDKDVDDKDDDNDDVDDDEETDDDETMYSEDETIEKECKNEVCSECGQKECVCESKDSDENLSTENCETDESSEETKGDEEEETFESVKAERDSLKEEIENLKLRISKYEASAKSEEIERIISDVVGIFSTEEISELKEEAQKYSLDQLNVFDNEVKAKAFDKVKDKKVENKNFTKIAINEVLDEQKKSKYLW